MSQYHNPQQEPGSERRLLIVFALTFVVLLVFQPLLSRYLRQNQPAESEQKQKTEATQPEPTVQPAVPPSNSVAPAAEIAAAPVPSAAQKRGVQPAAVVRQAQAESETVVENDLYRITFTNRGGLVKSWILKKHQDAQGHPLELVHQAAAEQFGYPLSLWTYDEPLRNQLNTVLYVPSVTGEQKAPADITFEYADEHLQVRKTFRFDNSYVAVIDTVVRQDREEDQRLSGMAGGLRRSAHRGLLCRFPRGGAVWRGDSAHNA